MSLPTVPDNSKRRSVVSQSSRMRLYVPAAVLALLLVTVLAASAVAPPNIDNFDDSQAALTSTIPPGGPPGPIKTGSVVESLPGGNILGTERDVLAQSTAGPNGGTTTAQVTGSSYFHSQGSDTNGRSMLVYDGADNSSTVVPDGLCSSPPTGCVDLTQNDASNGFRFVLAFDDLPMDVRIKVYDGSYADGSKYSEKTFTDLFPGGVYTGGPYAPPFDIHVEFAAILAGSQGGNGPANFKKVGAVEFEFIGKNAATDIEIEMIDVYVLDWGDLPDSTVGGIHPNYPTRMVDNGPRHVVTSLFLGSRIDPRSTVVGEQDGQPSLLANGDDLNNPGPGGTDDEDGVVVNETPKWRSSNGGKLDITVAGQPGCLSGWIDWNGDGDFADSLENILDNVAVNSNGMATYSFPIPAGTMPVDTNEASKRFYARFRLYPRNPAIPPFGIQEGCTLSKFPAGRFIYPGGEVEDYVWDFTPLAITLVNMSAAEQGNSIDVTWETVSEVDNTGFNLYRDASPDGPGIKLNASLIPSQAPGSPSGFSYSYTDSANLAPGTTYYYWLEDVSENGVATRHEPVSVPYTGAPTAVALAAFGAGAALPAALPLAGAGLAALMLAGMALAVRSRRA